MNRMGFMSATVDRAVAMEYAAKTGTGVVYEIQQSMGDRGADLSWLSMYPHEKVGACTPLITGRRAAHTPWSLLVLAVRLDGSSCLSPHAVAGRRCASRP